MYFIKIYQPLLSHAAHLLRALQAGKGDAGAAGRTAGYALERVPDGAGERMAECLAECLAECVRLAFRAKSEAASCFGKAGEDSWFPVHVWLSEKFSPFSGLQLSGFPLPDFPLPEKNAAAQFKARLDRLLMKASSETPAAEELALLRLYTVCLELGCGAQRDTAREEKRRRYIRLCRDALDRRDAPEERNRTRINLRRNTLPSRLFSRLSAAFSSGRVRFSVRAAALFAAPAATAALYCLYRAWLHSLLLHITGA